MAYFPAAGWVALALISAPGILAILHILAARFEQERAVHDLRVRASGLRHDYTARMAALKADGAEIIEADVVGEIGPTGATTLKAAA